MLTQLVKELDPARPVSQNPPAKELKELLDVQLGSQGCEVSELLQAAKEYLHHNPDVSQPAFFKLLYSGLNVPALLGDWVTALSNANMHTYQVSPVATLMELELINQWNQLIGFRDGDGVMVSGGSQANMIAMMLARQKAIPDVKETGIQGKVLTAFVSDQSHYSAQKAANVLGIGNKHLHAVESDSEGRISPTALRRDIQASLARGETPFFIGLTAGTTVTGAFDPIKACAEIATEFDLWLHIDGAWGAPVLFSDKHKHLLQDSELADSLTWDAHKLMNVPITAAAVLVKKAGLLQAGSSGGGSDYLFHADENADFNLGQRSIQCGRRADALKVWMSWKALGSDGFAQKIDALQNIKDYFVEKILSDHRFELLHQPSYLNILFRYVPEDEVSEESLRALNINICKQMVNEGKGYSDYATYKGRTGIRLILANEQITESILDTLLADIRRLGEAAG